MLINVTLYSLNCCWYSPELMGSSVLSSFCRLIRPASQVSIRGEKVTIVEDEKNTLIVKYRCQC